jgi:adenosylcobinamide-phosphate synthase
MSFFAILCALLIEQVRPLARDNLVHRGLRQWIRWVQQNLDAGRSHHGWLVWMVSALVPAFVSLAVHHLLMKAAGWLAALLWHVALLYVTLGFRQFSHYFTEIRDALDAQDDDRAREVLAGWQQVDTAEVPRGELLRHVIEYSVLAAHRHVFGVLVCYSIFVALGLGPAGAVLYRVVEFVSRYWSRVDAVDGHVVSANLRQAASRAWRLLDWLPARLTALGFAVTGRFEDAIDQWRRQARLHPDDNDGVVLAATSGAIDVRLGGRRLSPRARNGDDDISTTEADATESTGGRLPELAHLAQVVGLVWRTVVMWMLILALMTLARLLG